MALNIDLENRKAFVSGVSSGIGAGVARMLAQAGCDVIGCGRRGADDPGVTAFEEQVRATGRKGVYLQADLSDPAAIAPLMQRVGEEFGGHLDVLVSNAGRNIFKGASGCGEADWDECMNLDLASHWRLAKAARPLMQNRDRPACILVISSNHACNTIPGCFPYNVAKAGLLGLVQSLAIEWGPAIRCAGIAPGFIDTPGNNVWFNAFPDPQAERQRTIDMHPVGRIGTIEDIGALCAFLASPFGGFISGTTLLADGGRSALMQSE